MPSQDKGQPPKRVCLGKISTAHGIKGLVKILPYGDDLSLLNGALYTAETGEDALNIQLKNPLGKYMLAEIEGLQDRTQAENLRGTELYIDRSALPELESGYYYEDLIDRPVVDEAGETIGTVLAVENYGASDLLEIRGPKGTFLLPFTDDFVPQVTDKEITIKDYEQFL